MESQTIKNPISQQQLFNDFLPEDCKIEPTFEEHSLKKKSDIIKESRKCVQHGKENNETPYSPTIKCNIKPKLKKNDPKRPEYSYVALIYCALKQAPGRRLQLHEIYRWIVENHPYYKMGQKAWQNSIRHNLSLNECFLRVPRETAKTGERKGNYWYLKPEFDDMFKNGSFKRRKNTTKGKKSPKKSSQTPNNALNNYTNYANYSSSVEPNVSLVPSASNYYLSSVHGVHGVPPMRPYYQTPNMFSSSTENIDYISMPQHSSTFASQFVGTQNYYDGNSYATSSGEQRNPAPQLQHSSQSMQYFYNNALNFYMNSSASSATQPSEESRSPVSQSNAQSIQSMCNAYNNLSSAQFASSRFDSTVAPEYTSSNYCSTDSNTHVYNPYTYANL